MVQDVFNFATNKWTANVTQLITARSDACAAYVGGKCAARLSRASPYAP